MFVYSLVRWYYVCVSVYQTQFDSVFICALVYSDRAGYPAQLRSTLVDVLQLLRAYHFTAFFFFF